jgi:hypothetical protein
MPAAHPALRGMHDRSDALFLVAERPGSLEDHRAGRLRGARHASRELQRVQVPAARIQQAAEIAFAFHVRLQSVAVEQAHRLVTVLLTELLEPLGEFGYMPRLGGHLDMIGAIVALDAVFSNERLIEIQRLDRHLEQPFCILSSDLGHERLLAGREPENRLAAAAARRAIADGIRLEQSDLEPALRQVQGCRAPGESAADDSDVRLELSLERRAL